MKIFKEYGLLILGSLLSAISVNSIAIPNRLSEGGIPGLTTVFYYLFDIPPFLTSILLNALLVLIGFRYLSKSTLIKTVLVVILTSLFLKVCSNYTYVFENTFLSAIVAGGLMGTGIGMIYQGNGTAAGGTIIAKIMEVKFNIPKSKTILVTDLMVIIPSVLLIGVERMFLTIVSVYIGAKMIAYISEGAKPRKSVLIISKNHQEMADTIYQTFSRSLTTLDGTGYFSQAPMKILYVVVENEEILALSRLVKTIDETAFMVVTDTQNVFGNSFNN